MLSMSKKREKSDYRLQLHRTFQDHPQWSENCDQRFKKLIKLLEFFIVLGFFKSDFKKVIANQKV